MGREKILSSFANIKNLNMWTIVNKADAVIRIILE